MGGECAVRGRGPRCSRCLRVSVRRLRGSGGPRGCMSRGQPGPEGQARSRGRPSLHPRPQAVVSWLGPGRGAVGALGRLGAGPVGGRTPQGREPAEGGGRWAMPRAAVWPRCQPVRRMQLSPGRTLPVAMTRAFPLRARAGWEVTPLCGLTLEALKPRASPHGCEGRRAAVWGWGLVSTRWGRAPSAAFTGLGPHQPPPTFRAHPNPHSVCPQAAW